MLLSLPDHFFWMRPRSKTKNSKKTLAKTRAGVQKRNCQKALWPKDSSGSTKIINKKRNAMSHLLPLLLKTAELFTTPQHHHSNNSKQHIYFDTHKWSQQISLQQSNAVGGKIKQPTFHNVFEVLSYLTATYKFANSVCVFAVSISMVIKCNR